MGLPEGVARVEVLELGPDDVLVVSVKKELDTAGYRKITEDIRRVMSHERVVILAPGIELSVVRHERHSCAEAVAELGAMMKDLAP